MELLKKNSFVEVVSRNINDFQNIDGLQVINPHEI